MKIHGIAVDTDTEGNKEKIAQVQDKMESIEARLSKLEQGEPATTDNARARGPALIMGDRSREGHRKSHQVRGDPSLGPGHQGVALVLRCTTRSPT